MIIIDLFDNIPSHSRDISFLINNYAYEEGEEEEEKKKKSN